MTQPAYQRIADDLRQQIIDGVLAPGDKVPSRPQLRERYGVSDAVALQAVRLLISEGHLEARSGSGTYVRRRPELKRLSRYWYKEGRTTSPFREEMERQGRTGDWRVSSSTEQATEAIVTARPILAAEAEQLGEAVGATVMVIRRTYRTADRPVETADIIVPTDRYELGYLIPVR